MGLFKKTCYTNSSSYAIAPNPNPGSFTLKRVKQYVNGLVAEINYVGCTNFEGNKICVFENMTESKLRSLKSIDPHFANSRNAPVARFKPDALGWERACYFAMGL